MRNERPQPRSASRTEVGMNARHIFIGLSFLLLLTLLANASLNTSGVVKKEPIPPQPEGNFARASNLELVAAGGANYRQVPRPFNLFTRGQSIFAAIAIQEAKAAPNPTKSPAGTPPAFSLPPV